MSVYAEIKYGEMFGWPESELEFLRNYAAHEAYVDEMRYLDQMAERECDEEDFEEDDE